MDNKIKNSYKKLEMSEASRTRICEEILESADHGNGRKHAHSLWKIGLAACLGLALVIPTGVYAAGKISDYFSVDISKNHYQAEINLKTEKGENTTPVTPDANQEKETMKYVKVETDFGRDYKRDAGDTSYVQDETGKVTAVKDEIPEGSDGMYTYSHKDGFEAGKDLFYEVIYRDEDGEINLYDQSLIKELKVNQHKALLCQSNVIAGSRYTSKQDTDYDIHLYVFYEEYGYIIHYGGMRALGQKKLISLAEKTSVRECSKDQADRYVYISRFKNGSTIKEPEDPQEEITYPVKAVHQKIRNGSFHCQITDVKISSKVNDTDRTKFIENSFVSLWDKNRLLKKYSRETLKKGDGVSQPALSVSGTETIQPKMVYVTMKVKAESKDLFGVPTLTFAEKQGKKYFTTKRYWQYNRPEKMELGEIPFWPCYFRETAGGSSFYVKNMKAEEEQVFHFAYLVDGDMTDQMLLCFDLGGMDQTQYADISGK